MRAQANLPAVAVALLVVTAVTVLAITIVDASFAGAQRDAADRATAHAVAEGLLAADSRITERRNVINATSLDEESIDAVVPPDGDVEVAIDGETVYERGNPIDGQTARRLVVTADHQAVTLDAPLRFGSVTLPRRSPRATLAFEANASVQTVRANGRIVLYDPGGINGSHDVDLSRYETTTLRFDGVVSADDVTVTYYPRQTRKSILEVTVDA